VVDQALLDIGEMFFGEFGPLLGLQVIVKKEGDGPSLASLQVFDVN